MVNVQDINIFNRMTPDELMEIGGMPVPDPGLPIGTVCSVSFAAFFETMPGLFNRCDCLVQ